MDALKEAGRESDVKPQQPPHSSSSRHWEGGRISRSLRESLACFPALRSGASRCFGLSAKRAASVKRSQKQSAESLQIARGQEDGFGSSELGSRHIELAGRLVAEVQTKQALSAVVEKCLLSWPVEA